MDSTYYMDQEVYIISANCTAVMMARSSNKKALCMVRQRAEHTEAGCVEVNYVCNPYPVKVQLKKNN